MDVWVEPVFWCDLNCVDVLKCVFYSIDSSNLKREILRLYKPTIFTFKACKHFVKLKFKTSAATITCELCLKVYIKWREVFTIFKQGNSALQMTAFLCLVCQQALFANKRYKNFCFLSECFDGKKWMNLPEIYQDQDLYGEQLTYTSPHWQKIQNLSKEKRKTLRTFQSKGCQL